MLNLIYQLFLISFGIVSSATGEITGNTYNSKILFYNGATPQNFLSYDLATAEKVVDDPTYSRTKPLTIFIHGMKQTPMDDIIINLIESYISNGRQNFAILDWSQAANSTNFVQVGSSVPHLGVALGTFLNKIFAKGVSPKMVHLVGHSYGAYVASGAGVFVQTTPSNKLPRITGLDPGNYYQPLLQKTDACFVDIIHTDPGRLGTPLNSGTVDFRVNYYSILVQPGCSFLAVLLPFNASTFACSHNRVIQLYSESVKNYKKVNFLSTPINKPNDRQIQMGYNCPTNSSGTYQTPTNAESLYSK